MSEEKTTWTPTLLRGDCIELMNEIDSKSIDLIVCDLPYGMTKNK